MRKVNSRGLANVGLAAALVVALTACTVSSQCQGQATTSPTTKPALGTPPASLADLSKSGLSLYDAAGKSDWTATVAALATLKTKFSQVQKDIAKPTADQKKHETEIAADISTVGKAVAAKQRNVVMLRANRIVRVTSVIVAEYDTKVPQSVSQLSYLARELEVGAASSDMTTLKGLPDRMNAEWVKISPTLIAKGGDDQVKAYGDVLAKLKTGATADDYAKQAQPLLDTMDKIAALYSK